MLKAIGTVIILTACCLYGNALTKSAERSLLATDALISFVAYINTSIKTARIPLGNIFSSFFNEELSKLGFIEKLNSDGLAAAIKTVEEYLSAEGIEAMNYLNANIGGMDIESQSRICEYVEDKLKKELESMKQTFNEKRRMYRMLPVLAGISVIILIV